MDLIFATHNANKAKEISVLLDDKFNVLTLQDIGFTTEIEETGTTLKENAFIKAQAVAAQFNLPVFADDTGLEVFCLNNEPGVRSARYAGEPSDANQNMDLLLSKLTPKSLNEARFVTWICLMINGKIHFFEGSLNGSIIHQKTGMNGFGYDPIFVPENHAETLAQLTLEEKNKISHRAKAFFKMKDFLFKQTFS